MTIEYVAIERPLRGLSSQEMADKYRDYARVYVNGAWIAALYRACLHESMTHVIFFTKGADFSDPANPVSTQAVSFMCYNDLIDETINGLADLLPPF
jgi:hypothetical protein